MTNRGEDVLHAAPAGPALGQPWQLRLYVAGTSPRSELAKANVRQCCKTHFAGRYELEIIDLVQQPELAQRDQVLALPLLVRSTPTSRQYLVGTLSDAAQLLESLGATARC